jgi:CelD/BcsL family acetyltransferase involved in cellulose biosynthesis
MYGFPLRRLRFVGNGRSDYLDIIADDRSKEDVLEAVFTWLTEHQSRWDVVDLQEIPEASPTLPLPHSPTLPLSLLDQELCPYMPLAPTWEATIAGLGKKMRYNLGYYERLMRRQYEVEIGMFDGDRLDEGLDALFRLHTERWKKRWLPGVLSGDHTRAFHRELATLFLKRGWLRFHAIRLDGEIKAVLYCLAYKSKTCYYIGGFDPELARYSLGTVLTGRAIRQAVEEGCTEFDFLRGDEGYKTHWTDQARMNRRLIVGTHGIRSSACSAVCQLEMKVEHAAKRWMHRHFAGK